MTKQQKEQYQDTEALRELIQRLKGKKYRLDCGHHITFGHYFGSDITIRNGKTPEIICAQCRY